MTERDRETERQRKTERQRRRETETETETERDSERAISLLFAKQYHMHPLINHLLAEHQNLGKFGL